MSRHLAIALILPLALSACGRSFEPPPAVVTLDGLSPARAFAGARVTISGQNFEQPPEANLVFFGSTAAEVDPDSRVAEGELVVEVPALSGIEAPTTVTVSTTSGQAGLANAFTYRGPGHPLDEQIHHLLPIEASPNTIAVVLPDERLAQLNPALVTNTASRTVSLMDLWTGWHMDFGFPGQPLAAVLLPWEDDPAYPDDALADWRDDGCFEIRQYAIYATVLEAGPTDDPDAASLRTEARSKKLSFVVPKDVENPTPACRAKWERQATGGTWFQPVLGELPEAAKLQLPAPESDDRAWMPEQLHLLCLDLQVDGVDYNANDCQQRVLAVTDYYRPELAFVPILLVGNGSRFSLGAPAQSTLATAGSGCADQVGGRVGRVADLTHVPGQADLLAVVADRPEIWRIGLASSDSGLTSQASLIWPRAELFDNLVNPDLIGWQTAAVDPDLACKLSFTALSAGVAADSRQVFLAEGSGSIIETARVDHLQVLPGIEIERALLPKRLIALDSPVFALQAALEQSEVLEPHQLLYAATADGLSVIEPSLDLQEPLVETAFFALPASRGGPGSLARYGHAETGWDDRIALADAARNQLFVMRAGDLDATPLPFPAGSVRPQVAASQWADRLYLADPLSNTIRLIDQNTGLQDGKFPLQGDKAFGATGLTCLTEWGPDLLLVPLANEILDPTREQKSFQKVVVRRTETVGDLEALIEAGRGIGDYATDDAQGDDQAHYFHEALVAPQTALIYLVQYPEADVPGSGVAWPAAINPDGDLQQVLLDGGDFPDDDRHIHAAGRPLPEWVSLVRLSTDERLLVFFGVDEEQGQPIGRILIYPASEFTAEPTATLTLNAPTPLLVKDMAVWSDGDRTVLFFSLPDTGMVQVLQVDLTTGDTYEKFIETTGVPRWLAFSPDHKRLYVTHRAEGKLSIIETGCASQPEPCEHLLVTMPTELYPDRVVFHPSGKNAYLTHEGSNVITVIE